MAEVRLERIQKRFGPVEVLKDISLTVQDREFLVLVGPSGCGKSTVLRLIAGLEEPSSGEMLIGGRVVNDVAPKDRDIAMVFQNYALYPHMNVFDNMAFGLKMRKVPKAEIQKKVADAAKILELEPFLKRKPKELSGGQRQRVALGRAIVRNPKVFLMDEPLSNLDAKLRTHMRAEISQLHQRLEATTIYVTHDQVEAMTMGHRIVVLNKGVIQQIGTPMEVYAAPANRFVAGFIGQMNFVDAKKIDANEVLLASGESWRLPVSINEAESDLVLGLRPEQLSVSQPIGEHSVSILVEPKQVELLGSEKIVHFNMGETTWMAKIPAECTAQLGEKLTLWLDLNKLYRFNADGKAV